MTGFLNLTFGGLTYGGIYAVFGFGIVLLFRTAGLLNMAIGDFAMLGALGTAFLMQREGFGSPAAVVVVLVGVAVFAYAYDRIVLYAALDRRRKREQDRVVVVFFFLIAVSLFLENAAEHMFGSDVGAAPSIWAGPAIGIGGVHLQRSGLLVILLALSSGVALACYFRFSLRGKALSACGQDPLGARVVGVRQVIFRRWMFVATSVLAAIFGIAVSPLNAFVYNSGGTLSLFGLLGAAFAGFRRPGRAVAAGLLIGLAETYLGGYVSTKYQDVLLFAALCTLILVRPQILGHSPVENN